MITRPFARIVGIGLALLVVTQRPCSAGLVVSGDTFDTGVMITNEFNERIFSQGPVLATFGATTDLPGAGSFPSAKLTATETVNSATSSTLVFDISTDNGATFAPAGSTINGLLVDGVIYYIGFNAGSDLLDFTQPVKYSFARLDTYGNGSSVGSFDVLDGLESLNPSPFVAFGTHMGETNIPRGNDFFAIWPVDRIVLTVGVEAAVPEPASLVLLGSGALGLVIYGQGRRRRGGAGGR